MDINDNQQINTFLGGMNTDTSDALLNSHQYRYAENLRIVTDTDSNSGELRIVEGTSLAYSGDWGEILKLVSIRQYGVFIAKNENEWSVYRFTNNSAPERVFGPCSEPIWEEGEEPELSVIPRYESESSIKIYIADGIHQLIPINIAEIKNPVPDKVSDILAYTNTVLQPLEVNVAQDASGQLDSAKVQYAYRLYSKNGAVTKLSPLSKVLSLYKDHSSGYAGSSKTGRAVTINMPNDDFEGLSYIQIYRITYKVNGQLPEIKLIRDQKFNKTDVIKDLGTADITPVATSDFLSYVEFGVIPKKIESKNDYLFAANVKYTQTNIDDKFADLDLHDYFEFTCKYGNQYTIKDTNMYQDTYTQHASFRPGETYRFGIILYDEDGNKSSVKYFDDITVPDMPAWFGTSSGHTDINPSYDVKPIVVQVKQTKEINNCSRYDIVRCIRKLEDKRTITQGLLGRPMRTYKGVYGSDDYEETTQLTPSWFFSMGAYYYTFTHSGDGYSSNIKVVPDTNKLVFASPEYVYQPDDIQDILNVYSDTCNIEIAEEFVVSTDTRVLSDDYVVFAYPEPGNVTLIPRNTQMVGLPQDHRFELRQSSDQNANIKLYVDYITQYYNIRENSMLQNNKKLFFNYMPVFGRIQPDKQSFGASSFSFPKVPEWNDFAQGESFRYTDDVTAIGTDTYLAWSSPILSTLEYDNTDSAVANAFKNSNYADQHYAIAASYPIGTTGSCILINPSEPVPFRQNDTAYGPFLITVANITKNATPYGGTSENAKKNSVYYSFGDNFKNEIATHTITSGDSYIGLFQYNALHAWYDATYKYAPRMSTVYSVPLFMDIDLHGQFGILYNRSLNQGYYIQDRASAFDGYVQDKDAYLYNTAYNQHPDLIAYTPNTDDDNDQHTHDTRIHYSEQKTNGEDIDNWLQFKAMNFLDVDSRYGEITALKLFKDKLIFWQKNATGILAVNERVVLSDANDTQVVLGTGSVLERYDYFTTIYGMKPDQDAYCVTNTALYWWDGYNKEILQHGEKYSVSPLANIKNIRNYVNENEENNHPHLAYDNKYNEILCQCVGGDTVVYNETTQQFTSVYTFVPLQNALVENTLYLTDSEGDLYINNKVTGGRYFLFQTDSYPLLKYVVNHNNTMTKVFDIQIIGGKLYNDRSDLYNLELSYKTPLNQEANSLGNIITDREYDYRLNVPRAIGNEKFGGRLRGKTMQCELKSDINSNDFSLQYIITKYRMSWG